MKDPVLAMASTFLENECGSRIDDDEAVAWIVASISTKKKRSKKKGGERHE